MTHLETLILCYSLAKLIPSIRSLAGRALPERVEESRKEHPTARGGERKRERERERDDNCEEDGRTEERRRIPVHFLVSAVGGRRRRGRKEPTGPVWCMLFSAAAEAGQRRSEVRSVLAQKVRFRFSFPFFRGWKSEPSRDLLL